MKVVHLETRSVSVGSAVACIDMQVESAGVRSMYCISPEFVFACQGHMLVKELGM
jgi:hypothetical protein